MTRQSTRHAYFLTSLAFGLAMVAGVCGLLRCFVQSPQSRASDYLVISAQALPDNPLAAASAAWEAARLNPSSVKAWNMLAITLRRTGDEAAARQADRIAARLHMNDGVIQNPIYAMPAELRLSFLAHSAGDL
jgi:Tfp pilus assembly protein PilF